MMTQEDIEKTLQEQQWQLDSLQQQVDALREEPSEPSEPEVEEPPPPPVSEAEAAQIMLDRVPEWDAAKAYVTGQMTKHQDRLWIAMPDVETGIAPDDVYDLDTNTGGWHPF